MVGALLLGVALANEDVGLASWWRLRADLRAVEGRIADLQLRIADRRAEADALRGDELAIESAIRSDLGLVRPGELPVRLQDGTSQRNP